MRREKALHIIQLNMSAVQKIEKLQLRFMEQNV